MIGYRGGKRKNSAEESVWQKEAARNRPGKPQPGDVQAQHGAERHQPDVVFAAHYRQTGVFGVLIPLKIVLNCSRAVAIVK